MSAAARRRSFGSIANLGKDLDGRTRWRLRWREAGKRRTEIVRGSRRDAEMRLAEIHVRVGTERASGVTVGWLYENCYLAHVAEACAPGTRRNLEAAWRNHIKTRWADVAAADVRAGEVEDWLRTLAPSAAVKAIAILRWCLRRAVLRGDVPSSPLEVPISLPTSVTRTHDREIIRGGESIEAYAAAVRGSPWEAAWLLGACGGLRPGEMLGVKAGEVEAREVDGVLVALVPVRREADLTGGVVTDDRDGSERVKTPTSRRWAAVTEPWASRLLQLQEEALARGDTYLTDDGLGQPRGTQEMRRGLEVVYDRAGLRRILPRNLRPTFATEAHHGRGMATEDVARLMGHSRPVMTWNVYERPDADAIAATVARSARHS